MKPPPFRYARPTTRAEACALLAEPGARVLAGGQSLVPMLSARTARPSTLVDLAGIDDLGTIAVEGDELVIGAMVRQQTAETSSVVRDACPLLVHALTHVAHLQVRSRGTVVGSVAHGEPAAEVPTVVVALGGRVIARRGDDTRSIDARAFFVGANRTALAPDEMAVELRLPIGYPQAAFVEESRRHNDLPIAGVAVAASFADDGTAADVRVALGSAGGPRRLTAVEQQLVGGTPGAEWCTAAQLAAAAELAAGEAPAALAHAHRIAPVLVRRALAQLVP